jgi:hypothetical protein
MYLNWFWTIFMALHIHAYAQHSKPETSRVANQAQSQGTRKGHFYSSAQQVLPSPQDLSLWLTHIKNINKHSFHNAEADSLKALKSELKIKERQDIQEETSTSDINFLNAAGFQGNVFNGGAPPDNTLAISNNGNIVSVINCNVAYYFSNGALQWLGSFWELFNDATLNEIIYDPIVMYDSQADRFVMIAIHGFTSETSKLIVCFSKSNNPLDGWWIYKLSGNPLNNLCWLDYPKLGISNNEVYVTGNLFSDISGFSEAVIYQISKYNGYNGSDLVWDVWSNISGDPNTLIPVSYGQQGNYGPGLYFLTQNPVSGNTIELYELTDEINANPQLIRTSIPKQAYSISGNALQPGTMVQLITGDCRIMNAFYLDGTIHYVFQSDYQNSGYTGINYNRLDLNTLSNSAFVFGQLGLDCAYPSIASFATSESDKSVMISYLASSSSIFPETRAMVFDANLQWSVPITAKAGQNFVDAFAFDNFVRWGDYTGISRRHNSPQPEVWISGGYGTTQTLFGENYRSFGTWISSFVDNDTSTAGISQAIKSEIGVYPNPVLDFFKIEFDLTTISEISVNLTEVSGRFSKQLFRGLAKKGKNLLSFNTSGLASGVYILNISSNNRILLRERIIVK